MPEASVNFLNRGGDRVVALFGLLLSASFVLTSSFACTEPIKNHHQLAKIVADFSPNAKIIKKADIDTFCSSVDYPLVSNPGILEADFNGDKKNDYAVLLQLGNPVDTNYALDKEEYRLKKVKVSLVAFMAEGNEKFKAITLVKHDVIDAFYPLNLYIEVQPPDTIREYEATEDRKKIYLDAPGILLIYCERSAVVIYWNKKTKKFDEIWVSD